MEVGNNSLEKFSDEVSDVDEKHKDKVVNDLEELVVEEIQRLIKLGVTSIY